MSSTRIAIVHDYLTQRGGAERVVLSLLQQIPNAKLYTSIYRPEKTFSEFRNHDIQTSYLDKVPGAGRSMYAVAGLLPHAISKMPIVDADVVLASTSGWAHGVRTTAPIVAYCHTPARWLYEPEDYFHNKPSWVRECWERVNAPLVRWDQAAAKRVSLYIANSNVVADRIQRVYNRRPRVLHPPSSLSPTGPQAAVDGVPDQFLLTVGRDRGYKNTAAICDAVAEHTNENLVVVGGLPANSAGKKWPDRIVGVQDISDDSLRWLYSRAICTIAMSREDFGLTPVEGFSFGTPCVALRRGGYLESCDDEGVAIFVDSNSAPEIASGIRKLRATAWSVPKIVKHSQKFSADTFGGGLLDAIEEVVEATRGTSDRVAPIDGIRSMI